MKCSKVTHLISLYAEGEVDSNTRRQIETHLETCKHCKNEYSAMVEMMTVMGTLGNVEAPTDFLARLHEKIELGSWRNRIRQLLHIPKSIRYPLDIMALGTTAVLLFIVINMLQIRDQAVISPPAGNILARSEAGKHESIADIEKPVQMALFLIPEASGTIYSAQQEEDHSSETNRTVTIDSNNIYRVDSGRQHAENPGLHPNIPIKDNRFAEDLLNELTHPLQVEAADQYYRNKAVLQISRDLSVEGGSITSFENIPGTDQPEFINIRIPKTNYSPFLEKLTGLGKLEVSSLSQLTASSEFSQIRIQIIPPQYENQADNF